MPITALPTPPSRSDTANFAARGDAFMAALPTFVTEVNSLSLTLNANATAAASSAGDALAQANLATAQRVAAENAAAASAATSGATAWASGSYATGAVVWSPTNGQIYRRKSPGGASPTDPAIDLTNWYAVISLQGLAVERISTDTQAVAGKHYVFIASCVLTMPMSPTVNDTIEFTNMSGTLTATINPNGSKFRGDATTMTIDSLTATTVLTYTGATEGWV